jgi:hypothetical protein
VTTIAGGTVLGSSRGATIETIAVDAEAVAARSAAIRTMTMDELATVRGRGVGASETTSTWIVGRHGEMPSPRPAGMQSHHGVNSVWMEANIRGYDPAMAPAVLMPNVPSHNATRSVFNTMRAEIAARQGVPVTRVDWSSVSPGTAWRLAEEQFEAAQVPLLIRETYFERFNAYVDELVGR